MIMLCLLLECNFGGIVFNCELWNIFKNIVLIILFMWWLSVSFVVLIFFVNE